MISQVHIEHLREQVARAEQELAGWRTLLADAEARMAPPPKPCKCGMPGVYGVVHTPERCDGMPGVFPTSDGLRIGQPPYGTEPNPTTVMPAQDAWTEQLPANQIQAHERFEREHDKAVCGDTGGNTLGGVSCALEPGHDGDHDDLLGVRWPRKEAS